MSEETNEEQKGPRFNEFGVCIDCQDGIEECLHNNLIDNQGKITCAICSKEM